MFPLLVRAYGKETVARVMNLHPAVDSGSPSPLCLATLENAVWLMRPLVLIEADVEFEGCNSGAALMAACEGGNIDAFKFLVCHKARLSYSHGNIAEGRLPLHRSAVEAARKHPVIFRWLLVERHTEQLKIMARTEQGNLGSTSDDSDEVRCWSGPVRAGMPLQTSERRQIWKSFMFASLAPVCLTL